MAEPIAEEKKKHLEGLLDRARNDALCDRDVSFLMVVKMRGHNEIIMDVGGDEGEREQLMAFFLKWALEKSMAELAH